MSSGAIKSVNTDLASTETVETILQREFKVGDLSQSGILVNSILQNIVVGDYEGAVEDLKAYQISKENYPGFQERTTRFFSHSTDLINAIKAKKNFPKVNQLPPSKRQELNMHLIGHFKDLKISLQRIVSIELELRIKDSRSTIWVIQALFISGFSILLLAVVMEAFQTLRSPSEIFIEDVIKWLYKALGI